ncbi:MAG: FkbM family methyltransferase [Candidatus Tectomicrobia bacterium]|uniref:FkbM family methyltransferase n=1 Tax=Tectimicrobiota bacterium TaxID=2528274 RepID=A0A938B2V0_UNCTE|nr:FkbM family methyltransferase [Candidatus Tectomicrobia bacterium]
MPPVTANFHINRPALERDITLQLDPEFFSQRLILNAFQTGSLFEPETSALVDWLLQPGDTFIDIGGHVGFYTMLAAGLVGPSGRVYVFEPETTNYQHLLAHMAQNQLHHVFPFPWAVGHPTAVVDFYTNADNDGGHALWDPGRHSFNQKSRVHVSKQPVFLISLDDIFGSAQPGFAKLVKIDTEGNETNVLRGARRFLTRAQVPAVIAEVNRFGLAQLGSSEQEMRALMTELGYTTYALIDEVPIRLTPSQSIQTRGIHNVLFVNAQLQQLVAQRWPQDARTVFTEQRYVA